MPPTARQTRRRSADRRGCAPGDPQRPMDRADRRGSRRAMCRAISPSCRPRSPPISCASASSIRSPARCSPPAVRAILACPTLGRRPRHPHRPLPLQGVPQRRTDRRADRHRQALARRSRHLRARLLVLVRGGADRRTASSCATSPTARRCRCIAPRLPTAPAGPFHGPLVVSMRPMKPADAIRAIQITTRFPAVHGAPVHIGKPELIGITDIMKPDYGDPAPMNDGRDPGVLGLRGDAAVGGGDGEAGVLHHPLSGLHAGDRPQELRIRDHVRRSARESSVESPSTSRGRGSTAASCCISPDRRDTSCARACTRVATA